MPVVGEVIEGIVSGVQLHGMHALGTFDRGGAGGACHVA